MLLVFLIRYFRIFLIENFTLSLKSKYYLLPPKNKEEKFSFFGPPPSIGEHGDYETMI